MRGAVLLLLVLGVVAAGCGSGAKSPSVASLGGAGTTTSSATGSSPPAGGFSNGSGGGGFRMRVAGKASIKYSECMRAHGVKNFPDPNGQGEIQITGGSGVDPRTPVFQSAQKACQAMLPNGGHPSPAQLAKAKKAALAMSACMRAHGVKNFPDPTFSNGGIQMRLGGPGLDPNNPTFRRAQAACGGQLLKR